MPRSLVLTVAVLVSGLLFAACGGQESGPSQGAPASPRSGPVTIEIWHSETAANLQTLQDMADRFNASQDGVRVRAVYQGSEEEAMIKFLAALPSGKVPALIILEKSLAQRMIDTGAVAPAQDFVDREDYDLSGLDEKAVHCYAVDGKLWAMPFSMNIPLLYYNKTAFREAGLDPGQPPADLQEVRRYSEKIVEQTGLAGIAIDVRPWMERILGEGGEPLVDRANGYEGRATKVSFDSETGRAVFEWWDGMVEDGLALNVGRNPSFAEGFLAMAGGRAAMTLSYANALRSVVEALEEGVEGLEMGIGPLPGAAGERLGSHLLGRGLWVLNVRPEEEQEAAWKFVKWLLEPEQQAEWFAGSGNLPVSRSAVDQPAARAVIAQYPLFRVALDLYVETPSHPAVFGPLLGPYTEVYEIVLQAEEAVATGAQDPAEALAEAAERCNRVIADYNRQVGE